MKTMNMTDERCAESRLNFQMEDEERKAYIRRYIGVALDPETRDLVIAEYDKLIARYDLFTQEKA